MADHMIHVVFCVMAVPTCHSFNEDVFWDQVTPLRQKWRAGGCRADLQIMCPDGETSICEIEQCDGIQNCPKNPDEVTSWDESSCMLVPIPPSKLPG